MADSAELRALKASLGIVDQPKKKPRGRGGSATSFISELGGTGGAIGGAALGTAILPVVGTAIGAGLGGLLGATSGRLAENKIRDDEFNVDAALGEGLITGVAGAGPLRLLKVGGTLAKGGARKSTDLVDAIMKASDNAPGAGVVASQPLKTSRQGKLLDLSNRALLSQYGTISKPVARATNPAKTVGELADIGITKPADAERIAKAITGTDGILNQQVMKSVGSAGRVNVGNVNNVLKTAIEDIGLVDADAKSVQNIVRAQLGRLGGKNAEPTKVFQVMKALEKRAADLQGRGGNYRLTDPKRLDQAKALLTVRDELQDQLYNVAGANKNVAGLLNTGLREQLVGLNPGNKRWASFVDDQVMKSGGVKELRSRMAPFVRVGQIIDEADMNQITAGGRVGNAVGGTVMNTLAGIGASAVKNPAARMAGTQLRNVADVTAPMGGRAMSNAGIAGRTTASQAASLPFVQNPDMSLEEALMNSQQQDDVLGQMTEMEQPAEVSPYPRENLLADIQRDPENADKYIAYYSALQEAFAPPSAPQLTSGQMSRAAAAQNALNDMPLILDAVDTGKIGGLRMVPGSQTALGSRLLGTENLDAALFNMADNILRARTGAAAPEAEIKRFMNSFLPRPTDSPESQRLKLERVMRELEGFINPSQAAGGNFQSTNANDLVDAVLQSQGGYY